MRCLFVAVGFNALFIVLPIKRAFSPTATNRHLNSLKGTDGEGGPGIKLIDYQIPDGELRLNLATLGHP